MIESRPVHPTLVVGDILDRLANVPRDTPVLGYLRGLGFPQDQEVESWMNLTDLHFRDNDNEDIAVTIEIADNYDTRQW